jgi:hypothetical protein
MSAMARISAALKTLPVGLCGELSTSTFVLLVTALQKIWEKSRGSKPEV